MYDVRQTIDELNKLNESLTELMEEFPEGSLVLDSAFDYLEEAVEEIGSAIALVTKELKVIDGMQGG